MSVFLSLKKREVFCRFFPLSIVFILLLCPMAGFAAAAEKTGAPYTVTCPENGACTVDKGTYKGWRSYHAFCHVCHAQDAVGSTFAPSLLERLKGMDKARFVEVVTNGFSGQIGVMPAWKDNPNVMPRIDDLWSYLRARSDGVLKPGRPDK